MSSTLILPDGCVPRGTYVLHGVDFRRELARTVNGRAAAPPTCLHLEHRHGVCPHGNHHRDRSEQAGCNTIVTAFRRAVVDRLAPQAGVTPMDLAITRVAVGTDATTTTGPLIQLLAEVARVTPTAVVPASDVKASAFWFLSVGVANAPSNLQEFAVLAGGANSTPGSGKAVGRFLTTFEKHAGNTQSGQYDLTIG
jgi:hypothetical protein